MIGTSKLKNHKHILSLSKTLISSQGLTSTLTIKKTCHNLCAPTNYGITKNNFINMIT